MNDPTYSVRRSPTDGDSIIVRWSDGRAIRIQFDDRELRAQVDDFLDDGWDSNGNATEADAMLDSVLAALFRETEQR